jgi:DNA-binding response OmpR family regulator
MKHVLIIEDDKDILSLLAEFLQDEGFLVSTAENGIKALEFLNSTARLPQLILLDLMMPLISGEELLTQLQRENINIPTIVLTAKDSTNKRVELLNNGADDFLPKPFEFDELVARVRSVVRRSKKLKPKLMVSDLVMDPSTFSVTRDGKRVDLSAKEFALLEFLMSNKGSIVKETQIISHVWDREYDGLSNIVAVYIRYLRDKIDKPFPHLKSLIKTIRGFGYMITE